MIKLFRRIRQKLLWGNNIKKYLLYAVGEILLVMIGILLALQVSNWSENRKIKVQEQILLNQLNQEFKDDIRQLNEKIQIRNNVISSGKYLLGAIDLKKEVHVDSLQFHIQRTLYTPTFNTNSKNFFTSHNINLLQNDSLKSLLTKWPTRVDETYEEELVVLNFRDKHYIPFLTEHIPMRNIYQLVESDLGMRELIYPEGNQYLSNVLGRTKSQKSINALLKNEDFEDYLSYIVLFTNIANAQSIPLKSHMQLIINEIETSLKPHNHIP